MRSKLNTYVHVVERDDAGNEVNAGTFGPDDKVPAWARKAITNPDVWADGVGDDVPDADDSALAGGPEAVRPPTSGAGSGRDAWAAYASDEGVTVTADMDRAAIIAAVDAKK
jgi:hypothetical protein